MALSEQTRDDALQHLPALSLLSDDARGLVVGSFEDVSYPFGTVIVREGEPADAFYLVVSGTARVVASGESGDEVALSVLHEGDSFGEMGLLSDETRMATVRASGKVEALRLDRSVFSALTR